MIKGELSADVSFMAVTCRLHVGYMSVTCRLHVGYMSATSVVLLGEPRPGSFVMTSTRRILLLYQYEFLLAYIVSYMVIYLCCVNVHRLGCTYMRGLFELRSH